MCVYIQKVSFVQLELATPEGEAAPRQDGWGVGKKRRRKDAGFSCFVVVVVVLSSHCSTNVYCNTGVPLSQVLIQKESTLNPSKREREKNPPRAV